MTPEVQFERLMQRLTMIGSTPVALYGAGRFVRALHPTFRVPREHFVGVIDDDPDKLGCQWAGLPVISLEQAETAGTQAVIIIATDARQDAIWERRNDLYRRGWQVFCVPTRFERKTWDDCLLDQYEYSLAKQRGIRLPYLHSYPPLKPVAPPSMLNALAEVVRPGMTLCELGSGVGLITQYTIEDAAELHAVDFSGRLLYEGLAHRFGRHIDKLHLHHDETATLAGVPDGAIDVVYSFDMFVHVKVDLLYQFLRSIARVLKPDGAAVIHFRNWDAEQVVKMAELGEPGRASVLDYVHPDWLAPTAAAVGLRATVLPSPHADYIARFEPAR